MATLENKQNNNSMSLAYDPLELARIGYMVVGNQGIEAFCNKTKLSRSIVSRLLNGSLKSPPRVSTIYKFVDGNEDQAEKMLLACGYPFDSLKKIYDKVDSKTTQSQRLYLCPERAELLVFLLNYVVGLPVLFLDNDNDDFEATSFENKLFLETLSEPENSFYVDSSTANRDNIFFEFGAIDFFTADCTLDRRVASFLKPSGTDNDAVVFSDFRVRVKNQICEEQESVLLFYNENHKRHDCIERKKESHEIESPAHNICDKDRMDCFQRNINRFFAAIDSKTAHKFIDEKLISDNTQSEYPGNWKIPLFSISKESKFHKVENVFISAFYFETSSSTNELVIFAAQCLKQYIERVHTQTPNNASDENLIERTKFFILTNASEVFDVFFKTFPNIGLNIKILLLDGISVIDQKEIPSLG